MASIVTRNMSATSFQARVTGLDTGVPKSIGWYIDGDFWEEDFPTDSESNSEWITFDGLEPSSRYIITVEIIYANGAYWDGAEEEIYTFDEEYSVDLSDAQIELDSSSETELSIYINGLDKGYSGKWIIELYIYDSDGNECGDDVVEVDGGDSYSDVVTFSGLNSDTEYEIIADIYYEISEETWNYKSISKSFTTDGNSSLSRPDKFEWDAQKNKGKPFNITADEWCNLLDNINDVRIYKGYSKISSTTNADDITRFYYPSKGDSFLATNYNQCIYAFDDMGILDYSSYQVLSGNNITADRINFLRDTINNVE